MENGIIFNNGAAIVPGSSAVFTAIKKLAKDQPLNKPFFIKDGVIAEICDGNAITAEIREAGSILDDEYVVLDGERRLVEAWIEKWSKLNGR